MTLLMSDLVTWPKLLLAQYVLLKLVNLKTLTHICYVSASY
jgi:hypothetical protein